MFHFNPPLEESKFCTPFTYHQPFHSGFREPANGADCPGKWLRPGRQIVGRTSNEESQAQYQKTPILGRSTFSWGSAGESIPSSWSEPIGPFGNYPPANIQQEVMSWGKSDYGFGYPNPNRNFFDGIQLGASGWTSQTSMMTSPTDKKSKQNFRKTAPDRPMICNFCKNNKEVPDIYLNHYLYDPKTQVLACPVLRKHVCQLCGQTGDQAHTLQYCPLNREKGLQAKVPVLLKNRTITNSTGKLRKN